MARANYTNTKVKPEEQSFFLKDILLVGRLEVRVGMESKECQESKEFQDRSKQGAEWPAMESRLGRKSKWQHKVANELGA